MDALLERLPGRLMLEWMAFYTLEPFGGNSQFIGHAITAATIANIFRKRNSKAVRPDEFMPHFEPKREQTVDEQKQVAAMFTMAMNAQAAETSAMEELMREDEEWDDEGAA